MFEKEETPKKPPSSFGASAFGGFKIQEQKSPEPKKEVEKKSSFGTFGSYAIKKKTEEKTEA